MTETTMLEILARLSDELKFREDQLRKEMDPATARVGPMFDEEKMEIEKFNEGYRHCIKDFIRCLPLPLVPAVRKIFAHLYS